MPILRTLLSHTPVDSITGDIGYALGCVTFPFVDALPENTTDTSPLLRSPTAGAGLATPRTGCSCPNKASAS